MEKDNHEDKLPQNLLNETTPAKHFKKKEVSVLDQIRSQRKWNLDRIAIAVSKKNLINPLFDFVTIGSSGKDPIEVVQFLRAPVFSINLLIDVRINPLSRYTPKWNKIMLEAICSSYNIEYVHRPDYGVPKHIREDLNTEKIDYKHFFEWYDANVLTSSKVKELLELIKDKNPAFLCTELGPTYCHRHRIALRLEQTLHLVGFDI